MKDFKYKIGDVVMHTIHAEELKRKNAAKKAGEKDPVESFLLGNKEQPKLIILSRISEECPGGVQLKYFARQLTKTGMSPDLQEFHEIELVPVPKEDS